MKRVRELVIVLLLLVIATYVLIHPNPVLAQCGWEDSYICGELEGGEFPGGHFYFFFTPFGGTRWEWAIDPLLTDVSSGEEIDLLALSGKSLRIWMPEFDPRACDFPQCLTSVAGYQVVPSCEPVVNFSVEREAISLGECTTLHWLVDNVSGFDGVTLDGECVDPEGSRQVCPLADTTYTLSLSPYFGEITERVTVRVMVPTSTSLPPAVTSIPTIAIQPTRSSGSTTAQQIAFAVKDGEFTYLKIEGTNQEGEWSAWEIKSDNGLTIALTKDYWWKGTVVLIFDIVNLGQRTCVIDYLREAPGSTIAAITYTEGQGCNGEGGSAQNATLIAGLAKYMTMEESYKTVDAAQYAIDAYGCVQGIMKGFASGLREKILTIKNCSGAALYIINGILQKYNMQVSEE